MIRRLARLLLATLLLGSLALSALAGARLLHDPALRPLVDRSAQEIAAATDRMMAREATADRLAALITDRLAEQPRNWVALDALMAVVAERGLILPPAVLAARDAAWDEDTSLAARVGSCAACIWDAGTCTLSNALICQAPVALTPLGDVAGIARAGAAALSGGEVDRIDLGLSIVGLGATALVVVSGGSSAVVKAGAGTAKLARRMGLLSPRLTARVADAVRDGVDWAALPAVRGSDDLARAVRADAFAPLLATATDLGRLRDAAGTTETLHLLRYIDDGTDARRLANAAEALGPRTVGRIEVLGKARLMRATLRLSGLAWQVMAGMLGLLAALAGMLGHAAQTAMIRTLRRAAR